MTTNQTIDGVLISRQLAERLTEGWNGADARIELRDLLRQRDATTSDHCEMKMSHEERITRHHRDGGAINTSDSPKGEE